MEKEKGGFKTDEKQRQDEGRQSMLNKLSRNWKWSMLQPDKNEKNLILSDVDVESKETA